MQHSNPVALLLVSLFDWDLNKMMPASSLALVACAISASLLSIQLWPLEVGPGPGKAPWPEWSSPGPDKAPEPRKLAPAPPPLAPPATPPAPEPRKPSAAGDDEGSSLWLPAGLGALALAGCGGLLWTRSRPATPTAEPELCPEFRVPRRSTPARRRARGTVADSSVLQELASLECRR